MSNEIKPPGGFGPFIDPAADTSVDRTGQANFPKAKDAVSSSDSTSAPLHGLAVVAQFSKAELQDPEKLEGMVRASVSELVDTQGLTGPLSAADKQSLVDFLSHDPLVRRQVESYLRKVLV